MMQDGPSLLYGVWILPKDMKIEKSTVGETVPSKKERSWTRVMCEAGLTRPSSSFFRLTV